MKKIIILTILLAGTITISFTVAHAQTLSQDVITTEKAQVLQVLSQEQKAIPGIGATTTYQTLKVSVLSGAEAGQSVIVDDDYIQLKPGDVFYLRHTVNKLEGMDMYAVSDPYRLPAIYFFVGLFILCVIIFGGKQGIRGLVALAASFAFIIYLLLPGILNGFSPVLLSIGISALIIVLGSYITHGFNKVTTSAVIGMIATIIITGILAYAAIHFGRLTGFSNEESVYLNFNTRGTIDFSGLLLGGILIGLLGVLYDAAIGQAVAVDELHHVGPHLSRATIFKRALRIGREHIGALVNTLAIAYVGVSLPLLLLFYQSGANVSLTINQELFATEIIRTMIGSIGLVLAVPLTTLIAISMLVPKKEDMGTTNPMIIAKEHEDVENLAHRH